MAGNPITSGGAFERGQFDNNWNTIETAISSISDAGGRLNITTLRSFQISFTADRTDLYARVAIDLAQSDHTVLLDNIGWTKGMPVGHRNA